MPRAKKSAFETAVGLLAARERTRAGLAAALERRGFEAGEVEAALGRVETLGYLDDERAAARQARALFEQGRSVADVERRLAVAGVEEQLAATVARRVAGELGHDDRSAAEALVRARKVSGAKAARLLAARGFDEDLVAAVIGAPARGTFD